MALAGQEVTVLGAGVAGLAVARALALRGAKVRVLEQAEAIAEVGAGIQISPNGAVVLRALGLKVPGDALDAVVLRNGADGREVLRMDLAGAKGAGFHLAHRADLIEVLHRGALDAGVVVETGARVAVADLSGTRPRFRRNGGWEETGLLIGADGLHSVLRGALNAVKRPFFTGQIAWRAVIPAEPGAAAEAEVFMGPGRHLVSYPLRGGTLRNIVAVEERRQWVEEGWNLRDDPMEMKLAFEAFDPRVRGWLDQVEDVWLWGLFRHDIAPHWGKGLAAGGAAILGDAAHPTLPFLAQGANMALEDAFVLARELDRERPLADSLAAYEAMRTPRCRRIVAAANRNARAYHLREPLRGLAHLGLRWGGRLMPRAALGRFDWLYGHDVTG